MKSQLRVKRGTTPHRPHHSQKWCQITKYRRCIPRDAYTSLRYFEMVAVDDMRGSTSYKVVALSEDCLHLISSGSINDKDIEVIYFSDVRSISSATQRSSMFGDEEVNSGSQIINVELANSGLCWELHTIERKTKLMFHLFAAWRAYTDRRALGIDISISTGRDEGRHNRRLYEQIEAEILAIDPQKGLSEMQRSADLLYELSKAVLHDRTIKTSFFESMSLLYFALKQLAIVHATNLRDFNRVSQLKYALVLLTLVQSALFNSETIDSRVNLLDPAPFTFSGIVEVLTGDFHASDGFIAENNFLIAKKKLEEKLAAKEENKRRVYARIVNKSMLSSMKASESGRSPLRSTLYRDDSGYENDENNDDEGEHRFSTDFDGSREKSQHSFYAGQTLTENPNDLLSKSHRRKSTSQHLWSHTPQTTEALEASRRIDVQIEKQSNHHHHHHHHHHHSKHHHGKHHRHHRSHGEEGKEYLKDGDTLRSDESDFSSNENESKFEEDRHDFDPETDFHLTSKSILDDGIMLLKSSMQHNLQEEASRRVAAREAKLYATEYHRLKNFERIEAEDERLSALMKQINSQNATEKGFRNLAKKKSKSKRRSKSKNRTNKQRESVVGGTDTASSPIHARGYQALNRSLKKLVSPKGTNHQEHLSDHEDDIEDLDDAFHDKDLAHDAEIVAAHEFGPEHDELLHHINVLQCCILVGLESVTQHASLHEYSGAIESLAMACSNIQAFTSVRLVDYIKTFVHLVRSTDDGYDETSKDRESSKRRKNKTKSERKVATKDEDDGIEDNDSESKAASEGGLEVSSVSSSHTTSKKKTRDSQIILSWQLSNIVRAIHIMVMGSHLLRRKLQIHASEEIRFYLCQQKFINNIDPNHLYNSETLRLLWEILWECLEASKTGDMTVLERINYRSNVIMWSYKQVTGKLDSAEPLVTGNQDPETGALLEGRKKRGAIDHRAHEQVNAIPSALEYVANMWRSTKHRKMFPGFYRGALMAPSAESIELHNNLIQKLLGETSAAVSIMQTVNHDGTVINAGRLSSSSLSSSSPLNSSEESYSSYSSDSYDSVSEESDSDTKHSKSRRSRRMNRKLRKKQKWPVMENMERMAGDYSSESDASHSSESDESEGSILRKVTMRGLSSLPSARKSMKGRRRSVVARGLVGFGKALLN